MDENKIFTILSMALGLLTLIVRFMIERHGRKRRRSVKRKVNADQTVS